MQKLTDQQQQFCLEYASNGGNGTAAAKKAGYSEKSAHELARQLLEKSHVQEAIHRELMRLRFRSGTVGLNALIRVANDHKAPAAAQVAAARALMEHAGLLGTAKEVLTVREQAERDTAPDVDYKALLEQIGSLGQPCNTH